MSRRVHQPLEVETAPNGAPVAFCWQNRWLTVKQVLRHTREWIGVLDGEPQRDVFLVQSQMGVCELHFSSFPNDTYDTNEVEAVDPPTGTWLLASWCD